MSLTTTASIGSRTNTYAAGRMPYKSKAQARAVMANTSAKNPRHREARAYAKAKLRKGKRMGLPPRK